MSGLIYVKVSVINPNITLPSISVAGDTSVSFTPSGQLFAAAQPKLVAEAPAQMLTGICYSIEVERWTASGSPLLSPAQLTMTVGIGTATSTSETLSDCVNNTVSLTATIDSSNYRKTLWIKPIGSGPQTFSIVATNYVPVNRTININNSEANQGVFLKTSYDGPLLVGKCTKVRIALVNKNGFEVPALTSIPISPELQTGVGTIYADSNCYMFVSQSLAIEEFATAAIVYVKPLNTSPSLSVISPSDGLPPFAGNAMPVPGLPSNYVRFTPLLPAKLMGSHEFGAQKSFAVTAPPSANISCEQFVAGNWQPCTSGLFNGSIFNWTVANAQAKTEYRFRSNLASQMSVESYFRPEVIYGSNFDVMVCDGNVISNVALTPSSVESELSSRSTLCLGTGVTWNCSSPVGLNVNKSIVGLSSNRAVATYTGSSAYACVVINPSTAGTLDYSKLAHIQMNINPDATGCTSGTGVGVQVNGGNGGGTWGITLAGLVFNLTSGSDCSVKGVSAFDNNGGVSLTIRNSVFLATSGLQPVTAFSLTNDHQGVTGFIDNVINSTTGSTLVTAVSQERVPAGNSSGSVVASKNDFTGEKLTVYRVTTAADTPPRDLHFANNNVDVQNLANPAFVLSEGFATLVGNRLKFGSALSNLNFIQATSETTSSTNLDLSLNKIVRAFQGSFLGLVGGAGNQPVNVNVNQNSFLSLNTTSSDGYLLETSVTTAVVDTMAATGDGRNAVCHVDSDFGWNGTSGSFGGNLTLPAAVVSTSPMNESCY